MEKTRYNIMISNVLFEKQINLTTTEISEIVIQIEKALDNKKDHKSIIAIRLFLEKDESVTSISLPRDKLTSMQKVGIAILSAFATMGIFSFLPAEITTGLVTNILDPFYSCFIGLLSMSATMLIFFSVITGICNMGELSTLNKYGSYTIRCFISWTVVALTVSTAIFLGFMRVITFGGDFDISFLKDIYHLILGIIPSNFVSPFLNGNTLQLCFLSASIGIIILLLNSKSNVAINFFNEINIIANKAVNIICSYSPLLIYMSLTMLLLDGKVSELLHSWSYFALLAGIGITDLLIVILSSSRKLKSSAVELIKNIMPSFITGFVTASFYACMGEQIACVKNTDLKKKNLTFIFL